MKATDVLPVGNDPSASRWCNTEGSKVLYVRSISSEQKNPDILAATSSRECHPIGDCPDVIRPPRRHRRASLLPPLPIVLNSKRPHRPVDVGDVHHQSGERLVTTPVLTDPVRLAAFPGVAVPVRGVLSFHERRVDRTADLRRCRPNVPVS